MTGAAWACITRCMPARKSVRKRRSLRNPPSKRPSLAEQWDQYDAAVARTFRRNIVEMQGVSHGETWAREFVSKPYAAKMMGAASFDPEEQAREMWLDSATEAEVEEDCLGQTGAMVGFVDELERLTGRMFSRDKRLYTTDSAAMRAQWSTPFPQIQKMFKKPRGERPNY